MTEQSTATRPGVPSQAAPPSRARRGGDAALRVLAMITLATVAVQFALAGLGAFGGSFVPHTMLGMAIGVLALLVLVAALVARPDRKTVLLALLLAVLAFAGQSAFSVLAQVTTPWLGPVHALSGVVIFGITGWLMGSAIRRR